jgi:hypothetical protein
MSAFCQTFLVCNCHSRLFEASVVLDVYQSELLLHLTIVEPRASEIGTLPPPSRCRDSCTRNIKHTKAWSQPSSLLLTSHVPHKLSAGLVGRQGHCRNSKLSCQLSCPHLQQPSGHCRKRQHSHAYHSGTSACSRLGHLNICSDVLCCLWALCGSGVA